MCSAWALPLIDGELNSFNIKQEGLSLSDSYRFYSSDYLPLGMASHYKMMQ